MYFDPGVKERREDFFNFNEELNTLIKELNNQSTRMIVIKGVRRTGKSSLIRVGLSMSGLPHVILDARKFEYFSVDTFYDMLASSLSKLLETRKSVSKYLKSVKGVSISGLTLEFSFRGSWTFTEVLEALNKWGEECGEPIVLAFDEAQDFLIFPRFDSLLAHVYDYLSYVKLVLAGSEVGLLDRLLGVKKVKAPLSGRPYTTIVMKRLSREEAIEFLREGFRQAGVTINEVFLEDAVSVFDGVIGWLTYYGYQALRVGHEEAITKTLEEGSKLVQEELENFLSIRPQARTRYLTILKLLTTPLTWSEVKAGLSAKLKKTISDKQLTHYLRELVNYGFVEKINSEYVIADPVLKSAARGLRI
ncbi:MAG: ATP-binding protein [Zestosphaera sp.]